jgi:hypothetical protein
MIELATKPKTKAQQVRDYVAANPNAKPKQTAEAVGVGLQYVYTVLWNGKKKVKLQRAKAKLAKAAKVGAWKTIALASSGVPYYQDSVTDTTPKRMAQLAFEAGKTAHKTIHQKSDSVNHPAHYKVGGIETIDFIEAKKLNYRLGNVIKYLTRADHKGNKLEDLKKAQWYLEREIESLS